MFERLLYAMIFGNPMVIHNQLEKTSDRWILHPWSGSSPTAAAAALSSFYPTRRLVRFCDDAAMSTALQIDVIHLYCLSSLIPCATGIGEYPVIKNLNAAAPPHEYHPSASNTDPFPGLVVPGCGNSDLRRHRRDFTAARGRFESLFAKPPHGFVG